MCSIRIPFFLASVLLPFSNGSNDYSICSSPTSCGPLENIRYPFWVYQNQPGFCGLPDFKLDCENLTNYPLFWWKQMGKWYRVLSITNPNPSIVVSQYKNETCHDVGKSDRNFNNDDGRSPFNLGPGIVNITLFYDCPKNVSAGSSQTWSFQCSSPDSNVSVFYFEGNNATGGCESQNNNAKFPVSKKALDEMIRSDGKGMTLERVLGESFELEYNFDSFRDCLACQGSGGVCVSPLSSNDEFFCYQPGRRHDLVVILGSGSAGGLILVITLVAICYSKKLKFSISRSLSHHETTSELENGSLYFGVPLFSYKDLQEATDNFNASKELGNGGFGRVYYGKLRDGREVAVKHLYEKSYKRLEQFMNEVQILTCLRHKNLVSLYGCTSSQCQELLLVYEYICNGTVADHLYGEKEGSGYLSWANRMRIAIETASALSYLHASDIIHRDVKTNNILLDGNFSVKVADFGLSRLFPTDVTHVSTAPQGTPGYVDPEYHQCYQLTVKSDVYSFGVVLIELISSLPAVDMKREKCEINLSNYALKRIQDRAYEELIDSRLGFGSDFRDSKMIISVAQLAFQCLQHDKEFRPTMDEVLETLKMIESGNYPEGLEVQSSPTDNEDNDSVRLLMGNMYHYNQQWLVLPSPKSVFDRLGSGSTVTSNISKEDSNIFYSMSN